MSDYIEFIDAPAIREHLRTLPPLPPAQQCILIAQSEIRSLSEKLSLLSKISADTNPEGFLHGHWKFQSDDSFSVILERYLRVRGKRLETFEKAEPGVVYIVETNYTRDYGTPYSTFSAAMTSIEPLYEDEQPPSIRRQRIDAADTTLVARLSRNLEIVDIDERGGSDADLMCVWSGDLPSGYAYVPHPFKCGDIIRQGESYYVLDKNVECDSESTTGTDDSDMVLCGMSWDKASGSFRHEHILYTHFGTELISPSCLPERQQMLGVVADVMQGKWSLIGFLECFTNGYRDELEKSFIATEQKL